MKLIIGIDPGVRTGFAVKNLKTGEFEQIETFSIIGAMEEVKTILSVNGKENVYLVFEDARLRTWFGSKGKEALQGAGSIKRDSLCWQEFCEFHSITYLAVKPAKGKTKYEAEYFKRLTRWTARTSIHARDAAMLVWGFNAVNLKLHFRLKKTA